LLVRGCEYGLDVIGLVGERHMREHQSFREIHEELTERHGVLVSSRHVANLFRFYLVIVSARTLSTEAVQARLKAQGRLVLSVDAVRFDDVSPPMYVVREVCSGEILLAERVEKADTENLVKFLRQLESIKAAVVGIVTDKEHALISAVSLVFPGVPHQYCQTHFYGNLVKPMESDLATLGAGVDSVAKGVREVEQRLEHEKASPEELKLVKMVCDATRVISKARGDKLFDPAPLKRFAKLRSLHSMIEVALAQKGGTWPLLCWLLFKLAKLQEWAELADRLSKQVEVVRNMAHLLGVDNKGKTVERSVRKYVTQLEQELKKKLGDQPDDAPLAAFYQHVIAVTGRFWRGLFACYDIKELPANNNDLESFFRTLKWHQRRAQGKKSTAGGPLESFGPLLVQLWPQLKKRLELQSLLQDLPPEDIKRARESLQALAEPARQRRSFIRDSDAQIQDALSQWTKAQA